MGELRGAFTFADVGGVTGNDCESCSAESGTLLSSWRNRSFNLFLSSAAFIILSSSAALSRSADNAVFSRVSLSSFCHNFFSNLSPPPAKSESELSDPDASDSVADLVFDFLDLAADDKASAFRLDIVKGGI